MNDNQHHNDIGNREEEILQLVHFRIGSEQYAVDILSVLEIIRMPAITRIPQAPAYIDGTINLRDRVIPIINARRRFALEEKENDSETRIVVAKIDNDQVGLIVDAVHEILRIQQSNVESPPKRAGYAEYVSGVTRLDDTVLIILDLTSLAAEAAGLIPEKSDSKSEQQG